MNLGWKLFFSHLAIVVVGSLVTVTVAYLHAPAAFSHHIVSMREVFGMDTGLNAELQESYLAAIREIMLVAVVAASVVAALVSSFVAWRIIGPIRALTAASGKIAAGNYRDRVGIVWDDEIGQLARSFNRMAQTLEETETRRIELIGNLSHELKTPLSSIRSMMEGLVDGVLPPDAETFLDVQTEVSRLQRLTAELGELSRVAAGEITLDTAVTDPAVLCRRAAAHLESQFKDKGIGLHLDLSDRLPWAEMDRERILQVLLNLLGNALQYTDPGGTVRLVCRREGPAVTFSVVDTGIGIAPEDLPRLYDRFYRVDKSRSRPRGGSGIG